MTQYTVLYIHKICPLPTDVGPNVTLIASDLQNRSALGKALRKADILVKGQRVMDYRFDANKVVVFPSASVFHSIILTRVYKKEEQVNEPSK